MLYVYWVMPLHFCLRSDVRLSLTKSIPRELYHLLPQKSFRKLAKVCLGKDLKQGSRPDQKQQRPYFQLLLWGKIHDLLSFLEDAPPPSEDEGTVGVVPVKGFQMPATSASFGVHSEAGAELPEEPCSKFLQPPSREAFSFTTRYDVTFKSFRHKSPPPSRTPETLHFKLGDYKQRPLGLRSSSGPHKHPAPIIRPAVSSSLTNISKWRGFIYVEGSVKKRRLYGQDRPEGCLFHSASLEKPPKVSEVCLEGNDVRVCLPALRACKRPQSVHETYETCIRSRPVAPTGHKTDNLFRRHANNGPIQGHCPPTFLNCPRSFAKVGLHDKLSEVSPSPFHKDGVSWICGRLPHPVSSTPSGQNQKCKKGMSGLIKHDTSYSETTSQVAGTPYLYHSSCLSRARPLPPVAKREKQGFGTLANIRLCYSPLPSGQGGIGLVEGQPGSMEWKSSGFGFSRLSNRDRCLPTRLGGILQRSVHRGSVVSRGISSPHTLPRTSGWGFCCQDLCERQSSNASPPVNGQFDWNPLHKQNGGHKIPCSGTSGIRPMGVVPAPQYPHRGSVFARGAQCPSRPGVSGIFRLSRLETGPLVVHRTKSGLGPLGSRPVCLLTFDSTSTVLQLETRPSVGGSGCISQDWSKVRGYAFPPFALVGRCLRQLLDQYVSHLVLVAPVWLSQPWYPLSASRVVCSTSNSVPSLPRPADTTRGSPPLAEPSTSRLATIRQSYSEEGIS